MSDLYHVNSIELRKINIIIMLVGYRLAHNVCDSRSTIPCERGWKTCLVLLLLKSSPTMWIQLRDGVSISQKWLGPFENGLSRHIFFGFLSKILAPFPPKIKNNGPQIQVIGSYIKKNVYFFLSFQSHKNLKSSVHVRFKFHL